MVVRRIKHGVRKGLSWTKLTFLLITTPLNPSVLMTGGALITLLSLKTGFVVIVLGYLLLFALAYLEGEIGFKLKESAHELTKHSLGELGSKIFYSTLVGLLLIGWLGLNFGMGGSSLGYILSLREELGIALFGLLALLISLGGVKKISKASAFAGAFTVVFLVYGLYLVFAEGQIQQQENVVESYSTIFLCFAALFGNIALFVVRIPDFTRLAESEADLRKSLVLGLLAPGLIVTSLGMLLAVSFSTWNLFEIMNGLGNPIFGHLLLALAFFGISLSSMYSAALCMSDFFSLRNSYALVASAGILLALSRLWEHYVLFLKFIGIVALPLAGVIISEYYFVKRRKLKEKFSKAGLLSIVVGVLVGLIPVGIQGVNAFVTAGVVYYVGCRIMSR